MLQQKEIYSILSPWILVYSETLSTVQGLDFKDFLRLKKQVLFGLEVGALGYGPGPFIYSVMPPEGGGG